jgi:hypothetical protein
MVGTVRNTILYLLKWKERFDNNEKIVHVRCMTEAMYSEPNFIHIKVRHPFYSQSDDTQVNPHGAVIRFFVALIIITSKLRFHAEI